MKQEQIEKFIQDYAKKEITSIQNEFFQEARLISDPGLLVILDNIEHIEPFYHYEYEEGVYFEYAYGWELYIKDYGVIDIICFNTDSYTGIDLSLIVEKILDVLGDDFSEEDAEDVKNKISSILCPKWNKLSEFTLNHYLGKNI